MDGYRKINTNVPRTSYTLCLVVEDNVHENQPQDLPTSLISGSTHSVLPTILFWSDLSCRNAAAQCWLCNCKVSAPHESSVVFAGVTAVRVNGRETALKEQNVQAFLLHDMFRFRPIVRRYFRFFHV